MRSISPLTADHQHLLLHPQHPQGRLMIFLFVFFLDVFLLLLLLLSDAIDFGTRRSFFRVVRKRKKTKNGNAGFFFLLLHRRKKTKVGRATTKRRKRRQLAAIVHGRRRRRGSLSADVDWSLARPMRCRRRIRHTAQSYPQIIPTKPIQKLGKTRYSPNVCPVKPSKT